MYNKLVRDNIPEIIKQKGGCPKIELLNDTDYLNALNQKLTEEVAEYFENNNIDELADIVEVVYALVECNGLTNKDFDDIRLKKHDERGGFYKKICLVEVERKHSE